MKLKEKEFLVLLSSFIPFGPARIMLLISYFGSAESVWKAEKRKMYDTGLKEKIVSEFASYRDKIDTDSFFKKLKYFSVNYTTVGESIYPTNLKDIDYAPICLYFKGTITKADNNAISVVGTRKMTSYGQKVTEKFASELTDAGITIVSGLARGVDTCAHKTAISAGGRTIAVIASGLDKVYPPENKFLAQEIADKYGAVISEYPLGYPVIKTNFAARNRIISGLSKGVLVVEGERKSGTLLTASAAADQGRSVYAVPGPVTSVMSEAPLFLIQNGAKAVTSTRDILDELDLDTKVGKDEV